MEALIGKSINLGDPIGQNKAELEASCKKLSEEIDTPFIVNPNEGNEPCPFYCSSINKPFGFVFVGINPGKVLEEQENSHLFSWENTTWQELANFCVPTDIRSEMNGYQLVKKNNVESPFWKFFLRFHIALTGGEIFNTWNDLESRHANTEEFFIEHVERYSILNADLIPYKYRETPKFKTTNLLKDPNYEKYFCQLIQFIEAETKPDAWIVFFGKPNVVQKLLQKFSPDWKLPKKESFKLHGIKTNGEEGKREYAFYKFNKGQQKILLSPFLRADYQKPIYDHIDLLVNKLKEFEK